MKVEVTVSGDRNTCRRSRRQRYRLAVTVPVMEFVNTAGVSFGTPRFRNLAPTSWQPDTWSIKKREER